MAQMRMHIHSSPSQRCCRECRLPEVLNRNSTRCLPVGVAPWPGTSHASLQPSSEVRRSQATMIVACIEHDRHVSTAAGANHLDCPSLPTA
jgi:hypothetical protein